MKRANRNALVLSALLTSGGAGSALACDVGNIQCDNAGYRYVCQCYTSDGCQYYPDGVCSAYRSAPPQTMTRRIGYIDRPGALLQKFIWRRPDRVPSP